MLTSMKIFKGSMGTSIANPRIFLAGASGGVYALITAHIATIILNWVSGENETSSFESNFKIAT